MVGNIPGRSSKSLAPRCTHTVPPVIQSITDVKWFYKCSSGPKSLDLKIDYLHVAESHEPFKGGVFLQLVPEVRETHSSRPVRKQEFCVANLKWRPRGKELQTPCRSWEKSPAGSWKRNSSLALQLQGNQFCSNQGAPAEKPHAQVNTTALLQHLDSCQASPTSGSRRIQKCCTHTSEHRNCEVTNMHCLHSLTFWWFVTQQEKTNTAPSVGFKIAKDQLCRQEFISMLPEPGHTNPFTLRITFPETPGGSFSG